MNKTYKITLIPGDGVGPELSEATKKIIAATGVNIEWEEVQAGAVAIEKFGTPLPDNVLDSIKKNKVALKGPVTTPIGTGFRSVNVLLRKTLDLYANLRPCKVIKGIKTPFKNTDLVVVRENTEDLYAGVEYDKDTEEAKKIIEMSGNKIREGSAISLKTISDFATQRIGRFAFDYAVKFNRKKVTAITKANIMKSTDGLFLDSMREVAKNYPDITYEEKLIDNMCMQLVQKPLNYDVLVTSNLYGDILSDLCAGLIGGLGVTPGANIGEDIAVFEPVHGSAPKYAGQNRLNPIALTLSGCLMLEHLGEVEASIMIRDAIEEVVSNGKFLTTDLGGNVGTQEMASEIVRKINEKK